MHSSIRDVALGCDHTLVLSSNQRDVHVMRSLAKLVTGNLDWLESPLCRLLRDRPSFILHLCMELSRMTPFKFVNV